MSEHFCKETIEDKKGPESKFYSCGKKAKFKVRHLDVRGEFVERCLCGTHFNALQKNTLRIQAKTRYDFKLTYEEI